jgi:hypothetical protein
MRNKVFSVVVLLCVAFSLAAVAAPDATVLKLKAGKCGFHILDVNGVKPLADAQVSLLSFKDGKAVATATSDKLGKCTIDAKAGRYLLNVKSINVSVIDVSADAELAQLRLVMPDKPLQVGAQAVAPVVVGGAATGGAVAGGLGATAIVGLGVAGAVGVGLVVENNSGSSSSDPVVDDAGPGSN